MRYSIIAWAVLLLTPATAHTQSQQDLMPISTARPSATVLKQIEQDYNERIRNGLEWAYCVESWSHATSKDGDSVYVAESVRLIRAGERTTMGEFRQLGCVDPVGNYLPLIHVHPIGDCTPSRGDITTALNHPTVQFFMIICGPTSYVSYNGRMYLAAMKQYMRDWSAREGIKFNEEDK